MFRTRHTVGATLHTRDRVLWTRGTSLVAVDASHIACVAETVVHRVCSSVDRVGVRLTHDTRAVADEILVSTNSAWRARAGRAAVAGHTQAVVGLRRAFEARCERRTRAARVQAGRCLVVSRPARRALSALPLRACVASARVVVCHQRRLARVHAALGVGEVQVAGQRLRGGAGGQVDKENQQLGAHAASGFYIRSVFKHANSLLQFDI